MVGLAPKTYAYIFEDGFQITKCKGFPLSVENSSNINFHSMKRFVLNKQKMMLDSSVTNLPLSTTITNENIRQQKRSDSNHKQLGLQNRLESKIFQFDYNKGEVDWNTLDVYPYGYCKFEK